MIKKLEALSLQYGFSQRPPLATDIVKSKLKSLGMNIPEFIEFYQETNGLIFDWFEIFPLQDNQNIKRTWNSLERVNDSDSSVYLKGYPAEVRQRFLVFASIGGGGCAIIDRGDLSIWYEENDELHQTDLSLIDFIEAMCREVAEL